MQELWTEYFRPKTVQEYVFTDNKQRQTVLNWIKEGTIPHILLGGSPGTGKTTLAKVLINELGIDEYDVLHINASRDNGVDFIKNKVENFVQTMPFGKFKVVLLDEADYLSHNAQAILRGLMESSADVARFILTCNSPHKIMPALHSRCSTFLIDKTDQTEFTARMATIMFEKNIDFELDTLDSYVKATYPDLRKCLNLLQANTTTGSLEKPGENDAGVKDWKLDAVHLFKEGKIREARTLICGQVLAEEMDDVFTWCYNNLSLWGDSDDQQDDAILVIRDGLVKHPVCADPEINLSATLIQLCQIRG